MNQGLIKTPYLSILSIKFIVSLIKLIQSLIKFSILSNLLFSNKISSQIYNFTMIKSSKLLICVALIQTLIFLSFFLFFLVNLCSQKLDYNKLYQSSACWKELILTEQS